MKFTNETIRNSVVSFDDIWPVPVLANWDGLFSCAEKEFPRTSAEGNFGSVGTSNADARAIPTNGEIGRHETGSLLAKGR